MATVKQEKAKVKSYAKLAQHLEGIQVGNVELPAAVVMSSISSAATVGHLVIPRPLLFSGSCGVNMITLNAGCRFSNLRR